MTPEASERPRVFLPPAGTRLCPKAKAKAPALAPAALAMTAKAPPAKAPPKAKAAPKPRGSVAETLRQEPTWPPSAKPPPARQERLLTRQSMNAVCRKAGEPPTLLEQRSRKRARSEFMGRRRGRVVEPSQKHKHIQLLKWLQGLDGGEGALANYFPRFAAEFDSNLKRVAMAHKLNDTGLSQLDSIDPDFWKAIGVVKAGHKLLFSKGIAQLAFLQN